MKIFISGQIRGMPGLNHDAFMAAEKRLSDAGHDVMNPIWLHGVRPLAFAPDQYMHVCYSMIDICDVVVQLPGWPQSKGAMMELGYALSHGKNVMQYEEVK